MKKKINIIIVIIFITLISLPVIGHQLGWDRGVSLNENRKLASLPYLSLETAWDFSTNYVNYFNDNFGFRPQLLELSHLLNIKLFKVAPPDSGVTIGRDGWLFYTPDETYLDTINARPFSETDLRGIASNMETIQKHFESRGIHFYFMVAPNAQTVYPDELPASLKKVNPKSRLDQITDYFNSHQTEVTFINPVPDLIKSKSQAQLFYKYDTHWDDYGAFIAYQSLTDRISKDFPSISPKKISDFSISEQPSNRKDLESLMGVSGYYSEKVPTFTPKFSPQSVNLTPQCADPYIRCGLVEKQVNDPNLPTLVAFRDSFFNGLIPFISENFRSSTYLWGVVPYSTDIIDKNKPDIVIFEITERELWRLPAPLFDFQK
jgi:hypothetical protein